MKRHATTFRYGTARGWRRALRHGAGAVALVAASTLAAQISIPLGGPKKVRPSPNAGLLGAPADIAGAVADKGRQPAMRGLDERYHPVEVLSFLGLTKGVRALVVEHDPGYFGEIIGAALGPGGRATELVPPAVMRDPVRRAALSDDISLAPGLAPLAAAPAAARLAPDSLDFVLLHRAYDQLAATGSDDVPAFLAKLFAAVRPGGIVGIVDAPADQDDPGPATRDATSVKQDFARAGFVLDNENRPRTGNDAGRLDPIEGVGSSYLLKFRKPDSSS